MRASPLLLLSLFLMACGANENRTITEFNAAEWMNKDFEILYIYHTFTGHNDGLVRATSVYSASDIRIYRRPIQATGFGDAVLLYKRDSVLPCGELVYHPQVSAVYLSYKVMDRYNVLDRHYCGDIGTGSAGKRVLKLVFREGKLEADTGAEVDSLLISELENSRDRSGGSGLTIDSEYESLCALNHCIYE